MKKILIILLAAVLAIVLFVFVKKKWISPHLRVGCLASEEGRWQEFVRLYKEERPNTEIELVALERYEYGVPEIWKEKKLDLLFLPEDLRLGDLDAELFFSDLSKFTEKEEYMISAAEEEGVYALSLNGSIDVLLANTDLLAENELFVPSSLIELEDVSLALRSSSDIIPFVLEAREGGEFDIKPLADNILLNAPNTRFSLFSDQDEINNGFYSMESLLNIVGDEIRLTPQMLGEMDKAEYFRQSRIAMLPLRSEDLKGTAGIEEGYKLSVFPGSDLNNFVTWNSKTRVSVLKHSKNKGEAQRWIDFLISSAAQEKLYQETGDLPACRGVHVKGATEGLYHYLSETDRCRYSFFERLSEEEEAIIIREVSGILSETDSMESAFIDKIENALREAVSN